MCFVIVFFFKLNPLGNPSAIKLTGSGFDAQKILNNIVKIGTSDCSIISATSTQIICAPGKF